MLQLRDVQGALEKLEQTKVQAEARGVPEEHTRVAPGKAEEALRLVDFYYFFAIGHGFEKTNLCSSFEKIKDKGNVCIATKRKVKV